VLQEQGGEPHRREGADDRHQRRRQHQKELPEHQLRAPHRAAEDGLQRAALLLARGQIDRRIKCPRKAEQNEYVRNEAPDGVAPHFLRWRDILGADIEGFDERSRQTSPREASSHLLVAIRAEKAPHLGNGQAGPQLAIVVVDSNGRRLSAGQCRVEPIGDLDSRTQLLVGDLLAPSLRRRDGGELRMGSQRLAYGRRGLASQYGDLRHFRLCFCEGFIGYGADSQQNERHGQHRQHKGRYQRASITDGVAQLLGKHGPHVVPVHAATSGSLPTALTKASSISSAAKRAFSAAGVPSATRRPRWMMPTTSHSFSTSLITCVE